MFGGLIMTKNTSCKKDYTHVLGLFEKKELKQDLSKAEIALVYKYTLELTYLESYANANNKEDVEKVSEFFSYFCNKYDNYSSLPGEVHLSFDVAYFSDPTSFMSSAYAASTCLNSFE